MSLEAPRPPSRSWGPRLRPAPSSSAPPGPRIPDAIFGKEKAVRTAGMKTIKDETKAALNAELGEGKFTDVDLNVVFEDLQYKAYRKTVLERGVRSDGRDARSLRPISSVTSASCRWCTVLPSSSAGRHPGPSSRRSGPRRKRQDMDGLTGGATSKSFMLHYNFPPFSVGETGRFGAPGRREVGHGALAERSLYRSFARGRVSLLDPRRIRSWPPTVRPRWRRSAAVAFP